ncbi:MAG: hypothetical protein LC115_01545 [Bacteroidia bacterium]|nr:hypothetical protein [Bacteroidia bacterium]
MAKKKEENSAAKVFLILFIALCVIVSIIAFSPGIVIASLIDQVKPLTIGSLWGTTLITTLVILIALYFTNNNAWKTRYLYISIAVFIIGVIYTLFDNTNIIYATVKKMYPFIESMTK